MIWLGLLTVRHLMEKYQASSSIPVWLIVGVVFLVVFFGYFLIVSPRGSNKRRGRRRTILSIAILCLAFSSIGQISVERSVQLSAEYLPTTGFLEIKWEPGINVEGYEISLRSGATWSLLESLNASDSSYVFTGYELGKKYEFRVEKKGGTPGFGYIDAGVEIPSVHHRGRCLMVIEKEVSSLEKEIAMTIEAIEGDGWIIDSIHVLMSDKDVDVRSRIQSWYSQSPEETHAVYLLGHVPVPYSGNIAPDGHTPDHLGAWPADVYYAEMNGNWRDNSVNATGASGTRNDNIPGDGKWDNSQVSTDPEVQVGRVDFYNLPAFTDDYLTLTKKYLLKSLAYRTNEYKVKRRGLVENNFSSLNEGFGQNGWKNFATMFGADNVVRGNYEVDLVDGDYLWAYACGSGSYRSMGGVGNTTNLYVEKDIQAVFVMNFGSYFGDWDNQNSLMRAALASGMILTNAWAARPNWQFHTMALGDNIGNCALVTQGNLFTYETGFGARSIHISLLGDPTLRLHAMEPVEDVQVETTYNSATLSWMPSADADQGYWVLREEGQRGAFIPLTQEPITDTFFVDANLDSDTSYRYSIRAVKLETSASGSYFNTSIGRNVSATLVSGLPEEIKFVVDPPLCYDGTDGKITATVEGGIAPFEYLWSNADQDSTAENLAAGMYTLEITSSLGATRTYGPVEITQPDSILATLSITESNGMDGTVQTAIEGGTPPYTLLWGDGSLDTSALAPGFYDLQITDANGCKKLITFEVKMMTSIDQTLQTSVIISPNPATDQFVLSSDEVLTPVKLVIHNSAGVEVYQTTWKGQKKAILTENWPSGIYHIQGKMDDRFFLKKLIIE